MFDLPDLCTVSLRSVVHPLLEKRVSKLAESYFMDTKGTDPHDSAHGNKTYSEDEKRPPKWKLPSEDDVFSNCS